MFAAFVLVASTHFAALLSPGPDFFQQCTKMGH